MKDVIPYLFDTPIVTEASDVFWGGNNEHAGIRLSDTLVISQPFEKGSEQETQLLRMLTACKLSENEYQVIQIRPEEHVAWHLLRERSQASKVLLLGLLPAQLGINAMMAAHEVNNFNGVQWMPTASLGELSNDPQLKQHLWTNVFQKVYLQG